MSNVIYKRSLLLLLAIVVSSTSAFARTPPFKVGEVVVKGDAWEFTDFEVIKHLPLSGLTVLKVSPGKEIAQIRKLRDKKKKASLNYLAFATAAPNDTFYTPYQWNFPAIQAEEAWMVSTGAGVDVAVLDTGFRTGGNDSVNCLLPGIDIAYGDNDPADGNGHGTHVSGTIAQTTNNGVGVAGLAYDACILPVKVLNDQGSGTDADIAEGIAWAINSGARVINMSLGYPAGYTLDDFVGSASYAALTAIPNDVTVVVASGNDGSTSGVSYPASHPNTIAVGATGFNNAIAPYSNRGSDLDIVAPGGNTSQDLNADGYGDGILQETYGRGSFSYYFYQGTSMAAPHVAAAAALLISNDSALTHNDVLLKLAGSALDLGDSGFDSTYGHGLIQVADAFSAPAIENPSEPIIKPNIPTNLNAIDNMDGTATISWSDVDNEDGFKLRRQKKNTRKGTWSSWSIITTTDRDQVIFTDPSGTGYFAYQVSAYNGAGDSTWSDPFEIDVTSSSTGSGGSKKGGGKPSK